MLIFSNPFNVPTQLISQLKEQIGLLMIRLSTVLPISFKSIQFRQCTRYLTIYPSANLSHQLTIWISSPLDSAVIQHASKTAYISWTNALAWSTLSLCLSLLYCSSLRHRKLIKIKNITRASNMQQKIMANITPLENIMANLLRRKIVLGTSKWKQFIPFYLPLALLLLFLSPSFKFWSLEFNIA